MRPAPVRAPRLLLFNRPLAAELGWGGLAFSDAEAAEIFSGNVIPAGAAPVAMAYAGHQFGHFVPQLGDGRAILLGEVIDAAGARRDIHFKGSGKTPFSRGADGRSPLGPALREYIVSEGMNALGIPTTRSLAVAATGEIVMREHKTPGAVLTRVALSHIRVGTFGFFARRGNTENLRILAGYTIDRLYPELQQAANPYLALLDAVIARQARLVASWMQVGFIHGVMNTDNMAVSGETIDYGPCAFMDSYDPATVFSSIDAQGRYAYGNQGAIAQWNLARFAETLLPLFGRDEAQAVSRAEESIEKFSALFGDAWHAGMRRKLGLRNAEEGDAALIGELLRLMQEKSADFTLTFRALCAAADDPDDGIPSMDGPEMKDWLNSWQARLTRQKQDPKGRGPSLRAVNPLYIPRNHLVERAIAAAVERDDISETEKLLAALQQPYKERGEFALYARPPEPEERVCRTFCGT
jgi:serine/tyrosine/threonine adenylyltransferase